jgi:cytochrome o ubiquinol oxidase subunit 3
MIKSQQHGNEQQEHDQKNLFGFWLYLMTDCMVFASLFATYAVLSNATNGGPSGVELFDLDYVLLQTIILLSSSFTIGMALIQGYRNNRPAVLNWLLATGLLGLSFIGLELNEFSQLIGEGHSWQASAFLSAFFTLVGTHGLHITIGLLWLGVVAWQIHRHGITHAIQRRLLMFTLFWHFLDLIWIFIFTIVYLMGAAL